MPIEEMFFSLFWLAVYGGCVAMNGMIADQKGRNVGLAVTLSTFLTPVLPYLYLLAVPPLPKK